MTAPSLRLLLSTLFDYAGLFPPAKLNLSTAVSAYEGYSATPHRWMLGRFVLPLSQLAQFERCLDRLEQQYAAAFWPLSIILDPSLQALEQLAPWLEKQQRFTISALEFKLGSADAIAPLLPHLPPHSDLFFEVPLDATLPNYLAVLQGTRAAVKVRTGGLTAAAFPSITNLTQVIAACASARIPFKATAGLHHPLRGVYPLANGSYVPMHGFLNVALAAAFAYGCQATTEEIATLLQVETPDRLIFSAQEIICHDLLQSQKPESSTTAGHLPLEVLAHARSRHFLGIGSCSFQDPVAELHQLSLLSDTASTPSYVLTT